ncbi:MAG: hypothetical protein RL477_1681 [Pseudomonadota bacterium]|jgi:exopolysaccharide transport family protein
MSTVTPLHGPGKESRRVEEFASREQEAQSGLSIPHVLNILKRRRYLILGIALFLTAWATVYANSLTPLYSSEVNLVVEPSRQRVLNVESVVSSLRPDYYTNETEAAVLSSRELARKVVVKLDLVANPLFNPSLKPKKKSLMSVITAPISDAAGAIMTWGRDLVSGGRYSAELLAKKTEALARAKRTPEQLREEAIETATDFFLFGLKVLPALRSRVITVRFNSPDPAMAMLAANTVADLYVLEQLESKGRATTRASEWLNQRAQELRNRVVSSERRLEEFRRKSGIVEVGGASVYVRQRSELDTQLVVARGKRAETEARFSQVQKLVSTGADVESVAAVLDSPLIQKLREQETQILRKISELKTQLREGHPRMTLAENELKDLESKIASEVKKIVTSLRSETEIAVVREKNLAEEIARIQVKLDEQHEAEVSLRALESEVKANKQLYETILSRLKETGVQDQSFQEADARIISRAIEPSSPYYPRKNFIIVSALLISLFLGIGLAVLLEFFDTGFRSVYQLESYTGLPTLGIVPLLPGAKARQKKAHEVAADQPGSAFGEAIRTLRTSLMLANVDQPPKTVLITSSVPGEGKTSTALALAAMASRSGQKCIIIDCDIRHPSVHANLGSANERGLSDFLAGRANLSDVIEVETRYGIRYMTAGSYVPNPPDLLGSPKMRELLRRLSEVFDLIILDAPPLLAVSDALVLVRHVDRTVFVVRWVKTARQNVLMAVKQAVEAGASVAGMILTQVDLRKQTQYDSADSGYYQYHHYYTNE